MILLLNALEHLHDFEDFKLVWADGVLHANPYFVMLIIVLILAGIFTGYQIYKAHQLKKEHNNKWKMFAQGSLMLELTWAVGGMALLIVTFPQQFLMIFKAL